MDRPFWSWTLGLCWWAAMWWILGKYSTWIPSALCHCVRSSVLWWTFEPIQLISQAVFDVGFWLTSRDITQNLKLHKSLHATDWWLLHHWPEITVSMENFPSRFETHQKSHPIVRLSTFQISRTSVKKRDISCFCWKVYFLRNSFAWT